MEAAARSPTTLCALPLVLLQSVLARLPVDARARACVVCRAWNAALAERSLWARLDLSPTSGITVAVTDAVLRAAAARAGGQLEALDLSDCIIDFDAVLDVVNASGATLRTLCLCDSPNKTGAERTVLECVQVEAFLGAAPQLRVFDLDVRCQAIAEASRLLRGDPPCTPARVQALTLYEDAEQAPEEAAVLALVADVADHAWLGQLTLVCVPLDTAAALDALVDAALARQLRAVNLVRCQLSPASAPALARLLVGGLVRLAIFTMQPRLDVPAALLLSNALRTSTTLTCLPLCEVDLWDDPAVAVMLLSALVGHNSLRELDVSYNAASTPAMDEIAGATLCAVVAANAPALLTLDISHCVLGDAGLGPLVEALPHNTHLHTLVCWNNDITENFAHNRLLPAVQANTSLRKLLMIDQSEEENFDESLGILYYLQVMVEERAAAAPQ
jgi:hypothetical protein